MTTQTTLGPCSRSMKHTYHSVAICWGVRKLFTCSLYFTAPRLPGYWWLNVANWLIVSNKCALQSRGCHFHVGEECSGVVDILLHGSFTGPAASMLHNVIRVGTHPHVCGTSSAQTVRFQVQLLKATVRHHLLESGAKFGMTERNKGGVPGDRLLPMSKHLSQDYVFNVSSPRRWVTTRTSSRRGRKLWHGCWSPCSQGEWGRLLSSL